MMRCCFCNRTFPDSIGNNAEPLRSGRCCPKCNMALVIPFRMRIIREAKEAAGI